MTLRIATLNIWNRMGAWDDRLAAIRAQLSRLAPDVLALQEVVVLESGFDQAQLIADGLGYHVTYGRHRAATHPFGNAILSRWPARSTEVIELPMVGTDEHRTLVCARLDAPWGELPVFCTHLNWKQHEAHVRAAQIRFVTDCIDARVAAESFPAILVGDLNAEPESDEIRFLRGLTALGGTGVYYADAFALAGDGSAGFTFARRNPYAAVLREPNRRIDYVMVRGAPDAHGRGEPMEARVCFDEPVNGVFASDHFGVVATLGTHRESAD